MYYVYCDGELIYDLDSKDNVLIDPTVNLELNKAPTFDFSMPPKHPYYDKIERFKSIIQVIQDGEEIFKGRAIQVQDDMYMQRYVYCEGELAYLNDTIQRPEEFHLEGDAVQRYLKLLLESHNAQVDPDDDYEKSPASAPRYFEAGAITVGDPNDYLYRYTNMNSTMEEIKEDLVDDLGGYLRVRNVYKDDNPLGELQHRYLDYIGIEEYGKTSEQAIEFGENLLDYLSDIDQTDICTGIIPLGALLEDESEFSALQTRLTIADVNEGSDYLVIPEAVEKYGLILKTVTWDDVTTPGALKSNGEAYLQTYEYDSMVIEATAVDLSLLSAENARATLSLRTTLEAYDTVVYTLTAEATILEILDYEVIDRNDTGYAKITRISFSGNTVSVTVDNSSQTEDLDITVYVTVLMSIGVEAWRLGDMIFVRSTPHNLSDRFPLAKMQIPLAHPENTTVSLGTFTDTSLTARTNQTASGLRNFEDFSTGNIIASAVAQATALIDMKTNGYVTLHMDEDRGCVDELLIMDNPSTDTATRVWRWNLNGLGYSSSGYDTEHGASYETAITMDGHILGTLIIANGMVLADDNDETFGKFDDDGMKVYQQAGKDDLILLSVGSNGLVTYDMSGNIRTRLSTDGLEFWRQGERTCYMYSDGGHYLRVNEIQRFCVGSDSDDGYRDLLLENSVAAIELQVANDSAGTIGLMDARAGLWIVAKETSTNTTYLGRLEGDTIIRGSAITANTSMTINGGLTVAGIASSNAITISGDTAATQSWVRGLAVSTFSNDVPYATSNDLSGVSSDLSKLSSDLSSFESEVSSTYATKSELDGYATEQWVQDQGYITGTSGDFVSRDDYCYITLTDGRTSQYNGRFSYSTGLSLSLTNFFDSVAEERGWGSGYPDDIECHSLTASESIILARSGYDKIGLYCIDGVGTNPSCNGLYDFDKDLFLIKVNGTGEIVVGENYGDKTLMFMCQNGATFDGEVTATGFNESSDERLKTSIQPLNTSSLDNLTPVSFKWRDGDDRTHYGYIAQEVQPYFPELVREGTDGMLGLAYTEIIPLLHLEIMALKQRITQLEGRA